MESVTETVDQPTAEVNPAAPESEGQNTSPAVAENEISTSSPDQSAPVSGTAQDRVSDERVRQNLEEQMQNRINTMRAMMLAASGLSSNDGPQQPEDPRQMNRRLRLPRFNGLRQKIIERRVERALENYTMMLASTTRLSLAADEYNKVVSQKYPEFADQLKSCAADRGVTEDRIVQMLKDPTVDQREFLSSDGKTTLATEMQQIADDRELFSMRQDMNVDAERLLSNMDQFTSWSDGIKNNKMTPETQSAASGIMKVLNADIRETVASMDGLKAEDPEKPGIIEGMRDNLRNMMTKLTQTIGRMLGVKSPATGVELAASTPSPSEAPSPTA